MEDVRFTVAFFLHKSGGNCPLCNLLVDHGRSRSYWLTRSVYTLTCPRRSLAGSPRLAFGNTMGPSRPRPSAIKERCPGSVVHYIGAPPTLHSIRCFVSCLLDNTYKLYRRFEIDPAGVQLRLFAFCLVGKSPLLAPGSDHGIEAALVIANLIESFAVTAERPDQQEAAIINAAIPVKTKKGGWRIGFKAPAMGGALIAMRLRKHLGATLTTLRS
jgi:hypothetical protein